MTDSGGTWFDDDEERILRQEEGEQMDGDGGAAAAGGWQQQQQPAHSSAAAAAAFGGVGEWPSDSFPPDDPSLQLLPHDSLSEGMTVTHTRIGAAAGHSAAAAAGRAGAAASASLQRQPAQQAEWTSASAYPASSMGAPTWTAEALLEEEERYEREAEAEWAAGGSSGGGGWANGSNPQPDQWGTLPRFPAPPQATRARGRGRERGGYGGGTSGRGDGAAAAGGSGWSGRGGGRGRGRGRGGLNNRDSYGGGSGSGISAHSLEPSVAGYQITYGTEETNDREMGEDLQFDEDELMQGDSNPSFTGTASASTSTATLRTRPVLPLAVLPEPFRAVFPYPNFNRVQSMCFDAAFHTDENMVVAAPTGSGKTVVFELALLRFFSSELLHQGKDQLKPSRARAVREQQEQLDAIGDGDEIDMTASASAPTMMQKKKWQPKKAIYIAPLKALCDERLRDWVRFQLHLGLTIVEVTGDMDAPSHKLATANIIITTPEKWDALSRRMQESDRKMAASIGLMLVDEIHLLSENPRGAVLEGLMSRSMLRQQEAAQGQPDPAKREPIGNLRIIGLSATAPNANDVAEWLRGRVYSFADEHRPVPLKFHVYDYKNAPNNFIFESGLNKRLMELIRRHSEGRPTLVFVSTRKATTQAATVILNDARRMGLMQELVRDEAQRQRLEAAAQSLPSEMQELVRHGVGPHHGGLDFHCRSIIEQLFTNNDLRVLCSTSTLGQGVNLPAFLVIVRGTVRWIDHMEKELDSSTLTQMIGRAGRPQFDSEGVAVVMTSSNKLQQYSSILRGVPIESHLFERMIEHLNAEIVGSGIGTESTCMRWLKLTFMFTRMKKDPVKYFRRQMNVEQIEAELRQRLFKCFDDLTQANMLERLQDGVTYRPTALGALMARWYLSFQTVRLFNAIHDNYTFEDFLDTFSQLPEWAELRIKQGDKGLLNQFVRKRKRRSAAASAAPAAAAASADQSVEEGLDSTTSDTSWSDPYHLPYEVIGNRVMTVADKVKTMVQIKCLGRDDLLKSNFTLGQELQHVTTGPGGRVARAMAEYMIQRVEHDMRHRGTDEQRDPPGHVRSGWLGVKNAILFKKCVENGALDRSPQIFAQLPQVGPAIASKLFARAKTFDALATQLDDSDALLQLQRCAGRKAPFFDKLRQDLNHMVPFYHCTVEELGVLVELRCARVMVEFGVEQVLSKPRSHIVHLIVGTAKDQLLFYDRVAVADLPVMREFEVKQGTQIMAFMIDDTIVGCDTKAHTFMRYDNLDNTPSFADWKKCMKRVESFFALKEIKKRSQKEIDAAEQKSAAHASYDDELAPFDQSGCRLKRGRAALDDEEGEEPPPPPKPPCKHKAKACVEGRCKHSCCKERAEQGTVPIFGTSAKKEAAKLSPPRSLLFGGLAQAEVKDDDASVVTTATSQRHAGKRRSGSGNELLAAELIEAQAGGEGGSSLVGNKRIRMRGPPSTSDPAYFDHEASYEWNRQEQTIKAQQRAARQQEQQAQWQMDESGMADAFGGAAATPAAAASAGGQFGSHASSSHPASLGAMWTPQPSPFPGYAGAAAASTPAALAGSSDNAGASSSAAAAAGGNHWESLLDPEEQQDLATQRARQQRANRRMTVGARYSMF